MPKSKSIGRYCVIDAPAIVFYGKSMDADDILLFVDADSCPRNVRAIILRAIQKRRVAAVFAADRPLPDVSEAMESEQKEIDTKPLIHMAVVEKGENSADDYLVNIAHAGALAITRDIPLAARLAQKGLVVLDDRGSVYTAHTVRERLSIRNILTTMREYGVYDQKIKPLGARDIHAFANALDRELTRIMRKKKDTESEVL